MIAFDSAHGATEGVAQRIAGGLRAGGDSVELWPLRGDHTPDRAERLVVGSAIHNGQWLPAAEHLADSLAEAAPAPVWAFSVSSIGATSTFLSPLVARWLRPRTPVPRAVAAMEHTGALRGHRAFAGAISPGDWPGLGRVVFRLMGGRYGDARDWDDIDRWTEQILADRRSAQSDDGH
ncbi:MULTISPECIES: flavodoxin domain-containing protein [unclassified Gordonia (in: high G+C Gram-positive bacteria)]|uniref:flavodoxin domain-containing protein n=1 Tax=Gordonia TaxID=2053 RepID=UPI001E49CC12|nr:MULTISPECIES: flavodoxin domain-containing protein [unclassified Gordonia (in: high G+C Gram-positive bacteria)]MCX2753631.1 flavodoxin domain-containing protein [Gordonia sp. 4N]MDT0223239.1 flavodoxin domain-containing protein [Gordonia sp. AC31]